MTGAEPPAERGAEPAAEPGAGPPTERGPAELAPFTRRRLAAIAERALAEAGVAGRVPTPLDEVQRAAGIVARRDIADLPAAVRLTARPLLGALWFEARTVYVDRSQALPRQRFTDAHEAMHALCPWHEAALREDTAAELFGPIRAAVEAEANFGAGLLIFQGRRFAARIAEEPAGIRTPLALAAEYGASRQATLHQYTESHAGAVALLVAGRFPARDGSLPVWRQVASPAYRDAFGPAPIAALPAGSGLRELAEAARTTSDPPALTIALRDRDGRARACVAEAHYNRHAFLVLLSCSGARGQRRVARAHEPQQRVAAQRLVVAAEPA